VEKKKEFAHCKGSPCVYCRKNRKGRSCTTVVEGRLVCGCMRWYYWAVREWSNIHTQGERVMEARRERQKNEKRREGG
jgi:hypothetical protein